MTQILVLIGITGVAAFYIWKYRKENHDLKSYTIDLLDTNYEMKSILAMGLYYRYSGSLDEEELENERSKISKIFIKERPYEFEFFVAKVFQDYYGGEASVTALSASYGIHIEHEREDELYLIQVVCSERDLSYDPVAIVHSQMVKQKAAGGYVVSTGSFTDQANRYAQDLNIQLIDGMKLAEMWAESLEKKQESYASTEEEEKATYESTQLP